MRPRTRKARHEYVSVWVEGYGADFRGAAFVWEDGQRFIEDRDQALAQLGELGRGRVVVMYQAGHHLGLLFPQPFPPELRVRVMGGAMLDAHWGKVPIWDAYGLAPMPLAEIGAAVGLDMLPADAPSGEYKRLLGPYALRNAEIVYRLMTLVQGWARRHGVGMSARVGTLAVNTWLEHADIPIPLAKDADNEWGRRAFYPGRAEVYSAGYHEVVEVWDVNSMYPAIMANAAFPDPRTGYAAAERDMQREGFEDVTVEVRADRVFPMLPCHSTSGQVYYPTGQFRGVFATCELRVAEQQGAAVVREFHGAYYYRRMLSGVFNNFSGPLYDERKACEASGDTAMAFVTKRVLNSLWGRLGLKPGTTREIVRRDVWQPSPCGRCWACRGGLICWRVKGLERQGDYWIRPIFQGPAPDYVNVAWAAWLCARSRVALASLMHFVMTCGGTMVRCHTDSVTFIPGAEPTFTSSSQLGGVRCVYRGPEHTTAPNLFQREDGAHVAGVPAEYADEYYRTGRATVQRNRTLLEGLASNSVAYGESMDIHVVQLHPTRADGGARPWRVEELL